MTPGLTRRAVAAAAVCALLRRGLPARAQDAMHPGLVCTPMTVTIALPGGKHARLAAYVVRPDRPGRLPLIVLVHGTPGGTGAEFFATIARMSPDRYLEPATAIAAHGYAVVSILRRGFGASDGPYDEQGSGNCHNWDYTRIGRISAEDVVGAAEALRAEPWADPNRIVLLGHSTGGFAVTAAAATNPPGVVGVLNFAGGRGGGGPDHVCGEERLMDAFHTFGSTARVPALWLFAQNDDFYGPGLARRMFAAYTGAGAPARLVMLPPVGSGNDGHMAIKTAPHELIWPPVAAFLASLHLPT
jgi:dienelactone hydrolase